MRFTSPIMASMAVETTIIWAPMGRPLAVSAATMAGRGQR